MTYAYAGAFMAFSSENAKLLALYLFITSRVTLGKKLLQGYDYKFLKNFATRFHLLIPSLSKKNSLVLKELDFQSRGPTFKTTGRPQGQLSFSSFRDR